MKYKITVRLRNGEVKIFHISANTDLSIRLKTNVLLEKKGIEDESVVETIVEEEEDGN